MKNKRCAVLLATCDSYSDVWEPFFKLFCKYWHDIPYDIYLNTETKNFIPDLQLPFKVNVCNTSSKYSWSKRMKMVLNTIQEEYIFVILDDFFLKSPVDNEYIERILDKMDENKNIASFQLKGSRLIQEGRTRENKTSEFIINEIKKDGWKTHFVPTIWRKKILYKWLRDHESIWGFELYGSQRARLWNYKEEVYAIESPVIYDYLWVKGCSVIVNGKWLYDKKIDDFFKSNDIYIDYDKRGRITLEEYRSRTLKDTLKRLSYWQIVKKTLLRIRSLW